MLIVNAPGFFALSWAIIKKFIDPQTAGRIQIFSNQKKALKALEELVDIEEIPADYGGHNITINEAFMNMSSDPLLIRQEVELLHVKKRHKAHGKNEWVLKQGERIDICVFTRSASSAKVTVRVNGDDAESVEACCAFDDGTIKSQSFKLDSEAFVGPCTISLEAEDLDTAEKKHAKESKGYFLVVGDIKKLA
jgi:CRAL/TRIO domain